MTAMERMFAVLLNNGRHSASTIREMISIHEDDNDFDLNP
jgi:hypothetical protein